jgi:hypothetical protein
MPKYILNRKNINRALSTLAIVKQFSSKLTHYTHNLKKLSHAIIVAILVEQIWVIPDLNTKFINANPGVIII